MVSNGKQVFLNYFALPYAWHGNWRMMVYWLAAATLTACVTYTGGKA